MARRPREVEIRVRSKNRPDPAFVEFLIPLLLGKGVTCAQQQPPAPPAQVISLDDKREKRGPVPQE